MTLSVLARGTVRHGGPLQLHALGRGPIPRAPSTARRACSTLCARHRQPGLPLRRSFEAPRRPRAGDRRALPGPGLGRDEAEDWRLAPRAPRRWSGEVPGSIAARACRRGWWLPPVIACAVAARSTSPSRWRSGARSAAPSWDLAIFRRGRPGLLALRGAHRFPSRGPGYNLLGDHFHPIRMLALLGPIFSSSFRPRLHPPGRPGSALIAASVLPIARLAQRLPRGARALLVGLAYGLGWGLAGCGRRSVSRGLPGRPAAGVREAPPFVERRWGACMAWLAPLVLVKEDLGPDGLSSRAWRSRGVSRARDRSAMLRGPGVRAVRYRRVCRDGEAVCCCHEPRRVRGPIRSTFGCNRGRGHGDRGGTAARAVPSLWAHPRLSPPSSLRRSSFCSRGPAVVGSALALVRARAATLAWRFAGSVDDLLLWELLALQRRARPHSRPAPSSTSSPGGSRPRSALAVGGLRRRSRRRWERTRLRDLRADSAPASSRRGAARCRVGGSRACPLSPWRSPPRPCPCGSCPLLTEEPAPGGRPGARSTRCPCASVETDTTLLARLVPAATSTGWARPRQMDAPRSMSSSTAQLLRVGRCSRSTPSPGASAAHPATPTRPSTRAGLPRRAPHLVKRRVPRSRTRRRSGTLASIPTWCCRDGICKRARCIGRHCCYLLPKTISPRGYVSTQLMRPTILLSSPG